MGGRGNKKDASLQTGIFHPETITLWRRGLKHRDSKLAAYREQRNDEVRTMRGFIRFATGTETAHVGHATGVPEWYTPAKYVEAARSVLGEIDLDPASSKTAQETVRAKRYYTVEDDGLKKWWKGKIFLNPPYATGLVDQFVEKMCCHFEAGDVPAAILLVNNATETRWFQLTFGIAAAFCFPAGRIPFLDENGDPGAPLQGQGIAYFGDEVEKFSDTFKVFGPCLKPI